MRNAFAVARDLLATYQSGRTLRERPVGKERHKVVDKIVRDAGLSGQPTEPYFRLLAHSALAGGEAFYANWKGVPKSGRRHRPELDNRKVGDVKKTLAKADKHFDKHRTPVASGGGLFSSKRPANDDQKVRRENRRSRKDG